MSQYKLIYLDFRGRGELSRLLFALAGQEYEDVRFKREDWPAVKDKYIFGRIPVLEVDGKQYGQSMAIASFLAKRFGFHGSTDVEVLEVDQVLGIVGDIRAALVRAFLERDEGRKAEIVTENKETNIPRFLGFLETVLKNNNTGYYVGDKLAYADVAAFDDLFAARIEESLMERFPLVKANSEKVKADEKLPSGWPNDRRHKYEGEPRSLEIEQLCLLYIYCKSGNL
uniref:Glutathione-S-transferase isoform 2 n=1 Tax=Haliotis discus discus TaxID=91233 RepID=Q19BK1_HALDI|nr:glutathione-S-transferase isoform 2 [Haliotis discus discus]